jgi:DNA-directed RNA polymerase specialized sigma24 family protein
VLAFAANPVKTGGVWTLPETLYGQADPFVATQWSVVIAAGSSHDDPEISHAALAQLCQTYWTPLYTYARGRGHARHDAQDLTQAFFAYVIEHRIYTRADRAKGKFRSFLLASFKHFLSDARDRENTLKRGGAHAFVALDESHTEAAEALFTTQSASGNGTLESDHLFERTWAETLVSAALHRVAAAYEAEGKQEVFRELQPFLTVGTATLPTYAELATRLGFVESSLRSLVTRLRARYREMLRAEVRRTVSTESQVDGELRELLRILTGP